MAKQTEVVEEKTVAELREEAKAAGISGSSHMRKGDLADALAASDGGAAPSPTNAPDAVALLIEDHKRVKALFKSALAKDDGDESMAAIADQIVAELELHTQVEEQLFYPALKTKAVDEDDDDAKDEVLEAYVEHGSVKELIAKLQASSPSDESYKAMIQVMSELVEHHVEEEESEMFKQAKKLLGQGALVDLGQQITDMKAAAQSVK